MAKTRSVGLLAVVVACAVGAYWYWSPFVSIKSMHAAAVKKDAESFNKFVDYPKVRESMKAQAGARISSALGTSAPSSEMGRAGVAMGAMLGMSLVDRMIDAMVRPEMVMYAMTEAKLKAPEPPTASREAEVATKSEKSVKWSFDRQGLDRLVAYAAEDADMPMAARASFVFDRYGFSDWKLVEIRLPQ